MFSLPGFAILRVLGQQRGVTDQDALNRIALIGGVVGLSPVGIIVGDSLIRQAVDSTVAPVTAEVPVPLVVGHSVETAVGEIEKSGLRVVLKDKPPTAVVTEQEPSTGTLPPNGEVT